MKTVHDIELMDFENFSIRLWIAGAFEEVMNLRTHFTSGTMRININLFRAVRFIDIEKLKLEIGT